MNEQLDPQNSEHELAHVSSEEMCDANDSRMYPGEENEAGWPGDGSGMDDLADYNQNEAMDYANE
jgi:hypothetical protein